MEYNYEGMEKVGGAIKAQSNEFRTLQSEMASIVSGLISAIDGDARVAYQNGHNSVNGKYQAMINMLEDLSNKLCTARTTFKQADERVAGEIKRKFNNI